tara:strand:- start:43 stop:1518 length:1476 start_codon:yes stop_codon:yes gene_type:complete
MNNSKKSSVRTKQGSSNNSIDHIRSNYPNPKEVILKAIPDVADYIDRKEWRRAKIDKKMSLLVSASSEIQKLRNSAYTRYEELWENGASSISDHDVGLSGNVESAYESSLDLALSHLVVHGGRLAYLEFLRQNLGSKKTQDYPDFVLDVDYRLDDLRDKLRGYENVVSEFYEAGAIHISTLDMPELSVEESGSGRLKDIVTWEGMKIASGGMLHSKEVSYQNGILIIPREEWPFGISDITTIRNEWRDRKREWGDNTGGAYLYRGKEYVCVGSPKIFVAPRSYYENAVTTLSQKIEGLPTLSTQSQEVNTSEIDFKEAVLEFSKRNQSSEQRKEKELDLFVSQSEEESTSFDDLSFEDWLQYSNWFHSNMDRYNYLIWLEREYGPFQNDMYNKALIDASEGVKETIDDAKERVLSHQGLSKGKELLEQLSMGSVVKVSGKEGSIYLIKRIRTDLCSQMYEVECTRSSTIIPIVGSHAIARVVFLDIEADQM